MEAETLIPVSKVALLGRLRRYLAQRGQALKLPRGRYSTHYLRVCVVDTKSQRIVARGVDVVAMAKAEGLVKGWETVEGAPTHE